MFGRKLAGNFARRCESSNVQRWLHDGKTDPTSLSRHHATTAMFATQSCDSKASGVMGVQARLGCFISHRSGCALVLFGTQEVLPGRPSYFGFQIALQMRPSRSQGIPITFQATDH